MNIALHVIDGSTSSEMLRQLALLARPTDIIISIGPAPDLSEFDLPVTNVPNPTCVGALAGLGISCFAEQAEVIHAWSASVLSAASSAGVRTRRPVLLSLPHLPHSEAELTGLIGRLSEDGVLAIVPGKEAKSSLVAAGAPDDTVEVLPPAAAGIPARQRSKLRQNIRKALKLSGDDVVLIAPDEMTIHAGHKYACWAQAILCEILSNVRLLLPGCGPSAPHVRYFAHAINLGRKAIYTRDRFSRAELLAGADIALLLHEQDCGPACLAEAMAAHLAIVASRTPGIAEYAGRGNRTILVPPREPRAAAAAVLKIIEDDQLARSLAASAGKYAARHFTPGKCRTHLDQLYELAASRHPLAEPAKTQL